MDKLERDYKLKIATEGMIGDAAKYWGNKAVKAAPAAGYAAYETAGKLASPLRKAGGWGLKKAGSGLRNAAAGAGKAVTNTIKNTWNNAMKNRALKKKKQMQMAKFKKARQQREV